MIRFDMSAVRRATRTTLRLAMGSLLAAGLAVSAQAQERTAISGTTVSLTPLKGFAPSAKFAGLENVEAKASVLVVEMPPEAHTQLSALFGNADTAKANFAKQNIVIDEAEDIETAGGKGRILTGQQNVAGTTFDKWIVLLKGAKTVMITVQAPEDSDLDGDDVVAMLKTVSLGAEPTLDQKLSALPFRVRATEPFRVVDTFGGLGVLMTSGPLNVDPKGQQPMLIVSYQTGGQVLPANWPPWGRSCCRRRAASRRPRSPSVTPSPSLATRPASCSRARPRKARSASASPSIWAWAPMAASCG
jgi:hypothetical protein